jgi:neutral ceramidase
MASRNLRVSMVLAVVFLCLNGFLNAGKPATDGVDWKVGLAQVKITPERPIFLSGYASRNKPFVKIENDLFAKAMVFEDGAGRRAVLVTSDIIGFPAAIAEPICAAIHKKTGLKREQILLNSAHIHTSPMQQAEVTYIFRSVRTR